MLLNNFTPDITLQQLQKNLPNLQIIFPAKKDYTPSLWPKIKTHRFLHHEEKILRFTGLWQVTFNFDKLIFLQFNIDFGSRNEKSFSLGTRLLKDFLAINQEIRKLQAPAVNFELNDYPFYLNQHLSSSGLPCDRYVIFGSYSYRKNNRKANLDLWQGWPDQMLLEYREEMI